MPNINSNNFYLNNNYGRYQIPSKSLAEIKQKDNMTGKIADSYDPMEKPDSKLKSFLYSLLMSVGFVQATNWLLRPKKSPENATALDSFTNSRMYKIGEKADKLKPLQWLSQKANSVKELIKKIPLPQFVKEFGERYKIGSISTWDPTGMYSIGKYAEARQEFAKFFSEVSNEAVGKLKLTPENEKLLTELMKKVRTGKINPVEAYKQMEPMIRNVSEKVLKEISPKTSLLSRLLGATKDLSLSFNKEHALSGAVASGAVGKSFNKLVTLLGEASGGGVLGGKMALFGNALGLMTGFVAASEAEKGDKLKAFMEDYIGFTIGGYLMSMVIGKHWHKALGWAEFGMNLEKAKQLGKELGLEEVKRVQDVVIGFNKEVKRSKPLNKLLKKFQQGKVVEGGGGIFGWLKRLIKGEITVDKVNNIIEKYEFSKTGTDISSLYNTIKSNTKTVEELTSIRNGLKDAMKSDITFMSIFKGKNGSFINRLGRWLTQKPVAIFTKLLSVGKFTMLKPNGNKFGNFGRSFKRIGGGIGRMALFYALFLSPIQKGFAKLSHLIFGKPKKSILDDDNEKEKNNTQTTQHPFNMPKNNTGSTNLIDIYTKALEQEKNGVSKETNPIAKTNPTPQPKAEQQSKKEDTSKKLYENGYDKATYIPNQMLGQESNVDINVTQELLDRRDMALLHADQAEKRAQEVLAKYGL